MIVYYHKKYDDKKPEEFYWFTYTHITSWEDRGKIIEACIQGVNNAQINVNSLEVLKPEDIKKKSGHVGRAYAYREILRLLATNVHMKEEYNEDSSQSCLCN